MSDFDATLYFLDEREIEYLQSEVRREYQTDLRQNVVAILLDIFEQQTEPAIRAEIAEVLDGFMIHMLSAAQFQNVAYLVRESLVTAQRSPELVPEHARRAVADPAAPERAGAARRSCCSRWTKAIAAARRRICSSCSSSCAARRSARCSTGSGRLQNPKLRPMLEQAATRLASQNTAELVR